MSTSKDTIAFILEQLEPLDVRARAMFGEYGLYCDDKVVAFVCDDTIFLKQSPASAGLGPRPGIPRLQGLRDRERRPARGLRRPARNGAGNRRWVACTKAEEEDLDAREYLTLEALVTGLHAVGHARRKDHVANFSVRVGDDEAQQRSAVHRGERELVGS